MQKLYLASKSSHFVINNDILREICFNGFGISRILGICIEYLIKSIHRLLISHKNTLPAKAVRFKYPTILWVLPPGHSNFTDNATRSKLAATIEKSALLYNEMRFLKLWNWDNRDLALVEPTASGYRFTARGLMRYWSAIDAAVQSWDTGHALQQHHHPNRRNKYSW